MSLTENNLLVVDDDDAFIDEAKRLFDGRLPTARSIGDALQAIESGSLRMVILGPSFAREDSLDSVRTLRHGDPALISLIVAESVTANLLRAAMRVGVSDVIEAPLTEEKIEQAISQFSSDMLQLRRGGAGGGGSESADRGKVVTVMSAKGGSGKTVTATNLAVLLAREPNTSVCLVDADLQFGDVCLVLQLEPKFTVVNAAAELHRLDATLIESILTPHPSGLKVLAAPLEPAFADDITTGGLLQIIDVISERFDYVVVDTASLLDELLLSLLERSDQVLMVVDMDLPSVKNAKLALETLRLLKYPTGKVNLVLNRSNAKARLDDKEIEGALKAQIMARVPSEGIVAASVNEGRPVVESAPKSKVAKGFEEVAQVVTGHAPQQAASGRGVFRRN
ncbi:MAG: CpaE family protein [Acidimicrobiia bacterium]